MKKEAERFVRTAGILVGVQCVVYVAIMLLAHKQPHTAGIFAAPWLIISNRLATSSLFHTSHFWQVTIFGWIIPLLSICLYSVVMAAAWALTIHMNEIRKANSKSSNKPAAAYLVQLRNRRDPEYMREIQHRIEEPDPNRWLTPDEFEKRREEK